MFPTALIAAMLALPHAAVISPGEAVLQSAYDMYKGRWFKNAFYVKRVEINDNPQRIETWYEAIKPPGLTRVDVAPGVTMRAIVYRNDSTYEFGKGRLRSASAAVVPLVELLRDLHSAAPAHTAAMLTRYRFDLNRTYTRVWDGQPVVVVGASSGSDTTSNQIWLEKKRMLLVRLIEQNGQDFRKPLDARITGYTKAGNGWLEGNVRLFLGGVLSTASEYSNVRVDFPMEPGLFEPLPYHMPVWVRGAKDMFGGLPSQIPTGAHP
jgi:hypothetical protein